MEINTLEELAPWIAIAFTLALSILVPLFTQIANNCFQLRMQKRKEEQERINIEMEEKRKIYSEFLCDVGACIAYSNAQNMGVVGASIQKMYLVCPKECWDELDELYSKVRGHEWGKAEMILQKLNKILAAEYSVVQNTKNK